MTAISGTQSLPLGHVERQLFSASFGSGGGFERIFYLALEVGFAFGVPKLSFGDERRQSRQPRAMAPNLERIVCTAPLSD
jgi:hypothetical protein